MTTLPSHVSAFCDHLAVPVSERISPIQLVLDDAFLVEIREHDGRWFLCGQLNELPIPSDSPALENFLEAPFPASACGFSCFEPSTGRLIYWSEILPGPPALPPHPDLKSFLGELSELCKKVSLDGIL
jgi:hypothetical protein